MHRYTDEQILKIKNPDFKLLSDILWYASPDIISVVAPLVNKIELTFSALCLYTYPRQSLLAMIRYLNIDAYKYRKDDYLIDLILDSGNKLAITDQFIEYVVRHNKWYARIACSEYKKVMLLYRLRLQIPGICKVYYPNATNDDYADWIYTVYCAMSWTVDHTMYGTVINLHTEYIELKSQIDNIKNSIGETITEPTPFPPPVDVSIDWLQKYISSLKLDLEYYRNCAELVAQIDQICGV